MRECPKCNQVFSDEYSYCLTDGTLLDNEDEPTITRPHISIQADSEDNSWNTPTILSQLPFEFSLPKTTVAPEPSKGILHWVFLLVGLVIGGALVLGTFLILRPANVEPTVVTANNDPASNSATASNNVNIASANTNSTENANTPVVAESNPAALKKAKTSKYNGHVVALNAVVRLTPGMDGFPLMEIEYGTQIKIGRRASPNSPWYRVTLPNGLSGWMHGNTIEFVTK